MGEAKGQWISRGSGPRFLYGSSAIRPLHPELLGEARPLHLEAWKVHGLF